VGLRDPSRVFLRILVPVGEVFPDLAKSAHSAADRACQLCTFDRTSIDRRERRIVELDSRHLTVTDA
jgi:hypothetical protein